MVFSTVLLKIGVIHMPKSLKSWGFYGIFSRKISWLLATFLRPIVYFSTFTSTTTILHSTYTFLFIPIQKLKIYLKYLKYLFPSQTAEYYIMYMVYEQQQQSSDKQSCDIEFLPTTQLDERNSYIGLKGFILKYRNLCA